MIPSEGPKPPQKSFKTPLRPESTTSRPSRLPRRPPHPGVTFHRKPKPLSPGAATHNWESFLGPTHNAVSSETKLAKSWPAGGPPLVWEMERGSGYSSPAISGDKLVYLHRVGDEEVVECLEAETGRRFWSFAYSTDYSDRYGYNNGPRAAPVIADGRVYVYGAKGELHCLKLDTGQLYWRRDLPGEFKIPQDFFGISSTPLIEGDLLIVTMGAPGGPTVAAFDKTSGKLVWGAGSEWGAGYASPVPASVHGKRRVFVFAGGESRPPIGGLIALDPANGSVDFTFPWAQSQFRVGQRVFARRDRQSRFHFGHLPHRQRFARHCPQPLPFRRLDDQRSGPALEYRRSQGRLSLRL